MSCRDLFADDHDLSARRTPVSTQPFPRSCLPSPAERHAIFARSTTPRLAVIRYARPDRDALPSAVVIHTVVAHIEAVDHHAESSESPGPGPQGVFRSCSETQSARCEHQNVGLPTDATTAQETRRCIDDADAVFRALRKHRADAVGARPRHVELSMHEPTDPFPLFDNADGPLCFRDRPDGKPADSTAAVAEFRKPR